MSSPSPSPRTLPLALSAFVFLGALLAFSLEPMVGRILLPRFGGAFHVWTTSLMFFQGVLALAYGYAHVVARALARRGLGALHFVLLAAPLAFFPLGASVLFGAPRVPEDVSVSELLVALAVVASGPFFVLSTTSVLAQDWLARSERYAGTNAYRLYAVSNVGSLAALFVYALGVEPFVGLDLQRHVFTALYVVYAACGAWAYRVTAPRAPEAQAAAESDERAPTLAESLWWVAASAGPSALLMAVTNVLTVDAGSAPLLWILPLAAYLATFVLAFDDRMATPPWVARVWPHFAIVGLFFFAGGSAGSAVFQVVLQVTVLFAVAWAAHDELHARRPSARHLTRFYLLVAIGGWLGGAFVALVAPFAFSGLWEYPLALALIAAVLIGPKLGSLRARLTGLGAAPIVLTLALLGVIGWKLADGLGAGSRGGRVLATARSPYGLYHAVERRTPIGPVRDLVSGQTRHGRQIVEGGLRREPLSYYHREGPLGDVMAALADQPMVRGLETSRHYGAIGLGVGAVAAYLTRADVLDVYEIDPLDVSLARSRFHFLEDARGGIHVHVGDGRLALEREARQALERRFDVLLVDAFSGDSIPTHLLTIEAVRGYVRQLRANGILVFHVSNTFYELRPVLARVASELGLELRWKERTASQVARVAGIAVEDPTVYVVMWSTEQGDVWGERLDARGFQHFDGTAYRDPGLFTDDFAPSLRALRLFLKR